MANNNFRCVAVLSLMSLFCNAIYSQETGNAVASHWAQPLHLKIGYGYNFGSDTDLNATGFSYEYSNFNSPRVGFGYDIRLNEKWLFSPSFQLDINIEKTEDYIDETAIGIMVRERSIVTGDNDLEYIVGAPFEYAIYQDKNSRLAIGVGPQFTFNFIKILGGSSKTVGDPNGLIFSYEETSVNNTTLRLSGLLSLNYTTRFGRTPVRFEAFYAHSFGNQKSGTFNYDNFFNGESQTGDYSFKAHKVGLALSIFAFGHGSKVQASSVSTSKTNPNASFISENGYDPAIQWGFKAGYSENDIAATDTATGELSGLLEPTFYMGFYVTKPLARKWDLRSELLYSSINYNQIIQLPLQPKYTFIKNLSIFAGPNLNYIFLPEEDSEIIDRKFGVGIDGGFEYNFSKTFFAEARYNYGLTRQFSSTSFDFEDGRYSSLRFGIGVKF